MTREMDPTDAYVLVNGPYLVFSKGVSNLSLADCPHIPKRNLTHQSLTASSINCANRHTHSSLTHRPCVFKNEPKLLQVWSKLMLGSARGSWCTPWLCFVVVGGSDVTKSKKAEQTRQGTENANP